MLGSSYFKVKLIVSLRRAFMHKKRRYLVCISFASMWWSYLVHCLARAKCYWWQQIGFEVMIGINTCLQQLMEGSALDYFR